MDYLLICLACFLLYGMVIGAWYLYGIIEVKEDNLFAAKLYKYKTENKNIPYVFSGKGKLFLMIAAFVALLGVTLWLWKEDIHFLDWSKMVFVLCMLIILAGIDGVHHIIPNKFVLLAIGVRIVFFVFEFIFRRDTIVAIAIAAGLGVLFGFGLLFIMALLTKHAIGYGDVKLFGVLGLFLGLLPTYSLLLYSLIASSLIGIVLMVVQKKGRKYQIPFGPFVLIGYLVVVFCKLY